MEITKTEIIVANNYLEDLIDLLEEVGVTGYTAMDISRGKGLDLGEQLTEGMLPRVRTSLLFVVSDDDVSLRIIDKVQPYLNEHGGLMLVQKLEYATGLTANYQLP